MFRQAYEVLLHEKLDKPDPDCLRNVFRGPESYDPEHLITAAELSPTSRNGFEKGFTCELYSRYSGRSASDIELASWRHFRDPKCNEPQIK